MRHGCHCLVYHLGQGDNSPCFFILENILSYLTLVPVINYCLKGGFNMDMGTMWMGIAEAALNYIVVSTISAMNAKQTVSDVKTDLRTTKEDLMSELKDTRENLLAKIETYSRTEIDIINSRLDKLDKAGKEE